ncbi:hypothetical protein PT276_10685 [Orbaceae bacterium ESL0721]|nr:hypothetical protein [Orbaceae bacterium ESL0721]
MAIIPLKDAQKLLNLGDSVTGLMINVKISITRVALSITLFKLNLATTLVASSWGAELWLYVQRYSDDSPNHVLSDDCGDWRLPVLILSQR